MKIITWNCNGAFRNKFNYLNAFDADILIIQECENPELSKDVKYLNFATNYLWLGDNKNKGIGVFAKKTIKIEKLDWTNEYDGYSVKYFLPILINDSQKLIAVWAHKNNSPTFGYIGQIWKYFQLHSSEISNSIIIGDFNSNKIWDCWDRWWNHSDVVNIFNHNNLVSVYHEIFKEEQGNESLKSFFMHRKVDKGYHIDYCFLPLEIFTNNTKILIPDFETVKDLSDHVPLIVSY